MQPFFSLLACIAACSAVAEEPIDVYKGAARYGRPRVVVEPRYPELAREKGITGYVDVEGRVDVEERLRDVAFHAGSLEAEAFVGPLMESIGAWRFIRNIDDHCFPSDEHVVVRVWFELPEGHPKVSATIEKAPELGKDLKALSCPSPSYPYQALNDHAWAIVFASSDLAADGTVTGVMARAYPNVERDADAFASSVKKALSGCRYPSTDSGHRRRACTEVVFNLGG